MIMIDSIKFNKKKIIIIIHLLKYILEIKRYTSAKGTRLWQIIGGYRQYYTFVTLFLFITILTYYES